jgi:hypothetical protein
LRAGTGLRAGTVRRGAAGFRGLLRVLGICFLGTECLQSTRNYKIDVFISSDMMRR